MTNCAYEFSLSAHISKEGQIQFIRTIKYCIYGTLSLFCPSLYIKKGNVFIVNTLMIETHCIDHITIITFNI